MMTLCSVHCLPQCWFGCMEKIKLGSVRVFDEMHSSQICMEEASSFGEVQKRNKLM